MHVDGIDETLNEDTMLCNVEDMMKNLKDYMSIKEASEYLGVSSETLRRWDNLKKLKSYRNPINKYRLYKKNDLESFLKRIKQK